MDLAIHRNRHLSSSDIVFGILVVGLIQAKEVLVRLVDERGMQRTEFAIRSGIAEVKRKLPSLHLNRYCVRGRRSEIDARPGSGPKDPKGQNFCAHQKESRRYQTFG